VAESTAVPARPDEVAVEQVVAHEDPPALLTAARDADLLVVGSRGRGGFSGLLLGSVGNQVAAHAQCTVMIVRAPTGTGAG
jgi:nucleotide-binding universal stress UspA family protein